MRLDDHSLQFITSDARRVYPKTDNYQCFSTQATALTAASRDLVTQHDVTQHGGLPGDSAACGGG